MKANMKAKIIFRCCILSLVATTWGCAQYPDYEIDNPPFIDHKTATLYINEQLQLTVSPVGGDYQWSSGNESVAKVSQTGLVEALSEGFSVISVSSGKSTTTMEVTVREFIPLEGFTLSADSIATNTDGVYQISVYPVPENATESFEWTSADPGIAMVNQGGVITGQNGGPKPV